MHRQVALLSALATFARAQQAGSLTPESHPPLTWEECTANGCTPVQGSIVLDSNWRWVHDINGSENCYEGNTWNEALCPDNVACAENCALEGVDYSTTYGITTQGSSLTLSYVTEHGYGTNVGSRVYLLEDDSNYKMFNLLNREFTFDVDVSNIGCGLNGALYFVSMDADGGMARFPGNTAGAAYGTGYCDSQCARDIKFINGEANAEGWVSNPDDENAGVGNYGACCPEMDVWEANSVSTAFTPHSCDDPGQIRCTEPECGGTYGSDRYAGPCDPDGCDFNSFRMGDTTFYGEGLTVDTSSPMTVVTQFITDTGTDDGTLSEMRRFYVQNGQVIPNSESRIEGVSGNVVNKEFCDAQKEVFGDPYTYEEHGGWPSMSAGLAKGMVLVMSLWDDLYANMEWLDSNYPPDADPSTPGVARGSCENGSGVPSDVREQRPGSSVMFSNIKFGPLNSTFSAA